MNWGLASRLWIGNELLAANPEAVFSFPATVAENVCLSSRIFITLRGYARSNIKAN